MEEKMIEGYFHIGTITAPQGIQGEVRVYPLLDDLQWFRQLDHLYIREKDGLHETDIQSVKLIKGMAVLGLSCIPDRNEAEKFRGKELYILREQAKPPAEDEYFLADTIGMTVSDPEGNPVGIVEDTYLTGRDPVLVIRNKDTGEEHLVPAIGEFVKDVDLESKRMIVRLIPGM